MATSRPDYSFARRPIWLVGHLVVVAAVIGFSMLGMWQLSRHQERSEIDARVVARLDHGPVPIADLAETMTSAPDSLEFRRIEARGTYLTDDEVVWQARTLDGASGHQILTPLELADGSAIIVDRGWVPIDISDPPVQGAEPPTDEVTVTGYLRLTQERGSLGPVDPADGRLARISRVDVDRLDAQMSAALLPMWVQLEGQEPPQVNRSPRAMPAPEPGDGPPHLSYAVQWVLFAGVVAVGYPILLRATARERHRRKPEGPGAS